MEMEWLNRANQDSHHRSEILSFEEYYQKFEQNPAAELRPNCLYLKDMFNHFGKTEEGGFELFSRSFPDSSPVYGQVDVQKTIYQNLLNFEEEGFNNKFILLVGPNGSSKSSLIKKIMHAAQEYSKTAEGALYTFSWIFPIDTYIKGSLGLAATHQHKSLQSYAHLDDKEISAILPSELKDHPLLLIPKDYREELIDQHLSDYPHILDTVKKSYFYQGDLSKRNRMIYDALLKNYKGNHQEVLKHIRVERFFISKRYSSGAVTIEPQMHVDASMQQITMDKRLAALPPSLQSLNLFTLGGEAILANRGILEFSDLLKRPLDAFKYLLMTMETKTVNLRGILTELDVFFVGSSNEVHLVAFKQHPDFNSFKGRINFVKVPYLLNAEDEKKIYAEQIINLKDKTHFEPLSLESLCHFAVMTRIRPAQEKHFKNKFLGKLASSLSPLEKSLLYTYGQVPERMNSEEKQLLKHNRETIRQEYQYDALYEGKFGISPRIMKHIIYELASRFDHITFVEIFEYLTGFIELKNEYDFLNIPPQGEFNNPIRFLEALKSHALDLFDTQVRDCLGMVDNRSYEEYISRYVTNINALIKNEKIKNPVTGKFEHGDEYFIQEFEKSINLKEEPQKFRSNLISTLGAYFLDHPGKKLIYSDVFPELVKALKVSFHQEQKKVIDKIHKNLVFYIKEHQQNDQEKESTSISQENRELITQVLHNLCEHYSYSHAGVLGLLQYLLKHRY